MESHPVIPVPEGFADAHTIGPAEYATLYRQSVDDPETFWRREAQIVDWISPFSTARSGGYDGDVRFRWFEDGTLNVSANCLDRHLAQRGEQTAILWIADEPGVARRVTYRALHEQVCRAANVLKSLGVGRGDTVTIYMPMIPETAVAMLACARIGAVHSVVFGGFSADSLAGRIHDSGSRVLITADEGIRGGRKVPLKKNVDEALKSCPSLEHVLVVARTGGETGWVDDRDHDWEQALAHASTECPPEPMGAEDPLFVLYTSGSTGTPKGVLHTTGGYIVWASLTFRTVFDYRPGETYWCAADVGWVTGHSYIVYGPLANGATTVMFEGVPTYPDASRLWQEVDNHDISIVYMAPTAIRALMREGAGPVKSTSRASLRLLGTVGEPINPEAWLWFWEAVGDRRCPIVDTWWQTETGGHMITPLPGATPLKPGSATHPFFGVVPVIVDAEGKPLEGACEGNLCIAQSWPGQARTIHGDHARFIQTYFTTYPGMYFTGDGCRRDADGYYWITGRVDDVINVAGHRLGTAEIESALVAHPKVAEAAVVGFPHDLKGQGIYAYVTLMAGEASSDPLRTELLQWVRKQIGPIAQPDFVQWAPGLPKTRSGKIMRRILRKIAANEQDLGDVTTLAEPAVVEDLHSNRMNR